MKKSGLAVRSRCPFLYHLPLTYMSKCLSINKSKVQRLRKEAVNASYILVTKNFYFTKVPLEQVNNFKKYSDKKINDGFIRIINKQVMLQKPDYIKSNLVFYKKRSLRFVHSYLWKKMIPLLKVVNTNSEHLSRDVNTKQVQTCLCFF